MCDEMTLGVHLLNYLIEQHCFASKKEISSVLGISKRQLQRLMNAPEKTKGGTIALSKILCYFGRHNIPFDPVLAEILNVASPSNEQISAAYSDAKGGEAYTHLRLPLIQGLTGEGEDAYKYCEDFIRLLSRCLCPSCNIWCNPWDGQEVLLSRPCLVMKTAHSLAGVLQSAYTPKDVIL